MVPDLPADEKTTATKLKEETCNEWFIPIYAHCCGMKLLLVVMMNEQGTPRDKAHDPYSSRSSAAYAALEPCPGTEKGTPEPQLLCHGTIQIAHVSSMVKRRKRDKRRIEIDQFIVNCYL